MLERAENVGWAQPDVVGVVVVDEVELVDELEAGELVGGTVLLVVA